MCFLVYFYINYYNLFFVLVVTMLVTAITTLYDYTLFSIIYCEVGYGNET